MDLVTTGYLLALVALGGVSAYVADSLAWRIGKRRLSLLNMRPKKFARTVVTITGMLIPLFTILIVAGISADFRAWVSRGRAALQELPQAVSELNSSRSELLRVEALRKGIETANQTLSGANKRLNRQIASQRSELERSSRQLSAQKGQLSRLGGQISSLVQRQTALTRQAAISAQKASVLIRRNGEVQKNLTVVQRQLTAAGGLLRAQKSRLKEVQSAARQAESDFKRAYNDLEDIRNRNNLLTKINADLKSDSEELRTSIDSLKREIDTLTSARDIARNEAAVAQSALETLQNSVEGLRQTQDKLSALVEGSRTSPLLFARGDELARLSVPAGASVMEARSYVVTLLRDAARVATLRGATPSGSGAGSRAAADLWTRPVDGRALDREQLIDLLATRAAGGSVPQLIIARSEFNFFGNESVALAVEVQPNPVVFRTGDLVAEARVDGRGSDASIYTQIAEFLGSRVKAAARDAKLVPRMERGEERFGEVDTVAVFDLMRQMKEAARVVRLQAIANAEISAGDPLRIDLRLK